MRPSLLTLLSITACIAAACTTSPANDAGNPFHGVGANCSSTADCRAMLQCDPSTRTCQPLGTATMGMPCQLTADCVGGLYCSPAGKCQTGGDTPPGGTCTADASCVVGAVCFRAVPGLYGTCAYPRGVTPPSTDAGTGTPYDAGPGATTMANDLGGACNDALDCLAGLACSAAHQCVPGPTAAAATVWPGETCTPDPSTAPVRAYFEIPSADGTPPHDFFRLPFPNDIRRDPTTHRVNLTGFPHPGTSLLGFDIVDLYARASERDLDGFGTNQQVYFRFSNTIDFGTLTLGTTVQLIDLTAGGPTSSVGFGANTAGNRYLCGNFLTVGTGSGAPMVPGHTYAALLTNGIRAPGTPAMNGMPAVLGPLVVRDANFDVVMAASAPSDPVQAAAWNAYAPLRAYLAAHSIDPATIISAAVFTTQHPTDEVGALRTAVRAQPAPTATGFVRCDTGVMSPCDDGLTGAAHTRGCLGAPDPRFDELQGQIALPIVQQGARPYRTVGDGAIALDASQHPMVQGTEPVCVTVTVPHGVTAPVGGWPTVLYAHGTGGSYRSAVTEGLAAALSDIDLGSGAHAHFVVVGYDGVMHGPRRGSGVTDSPNTLFFNFANPVAARDNVLQGAADVFALVRALDSLTFANLPTAGTTTAFDAARLYFVGQSQGSTVGLPASAFEPGLAGFVFAGAGGDLRVSLTTKRHPVDIASLTPYVLQDPSADGGHPAVNLFQAFFERADAVNYAPLMLFAQPAGVTTLRPVVQTYGLGDTYSPEGTMRAIATAMGLPAADPIPGGANAWPGMTGLALPVMNNLSAANGTTTAAIVEADPMGAYDGHFVLFNDPTLQHRVLTFLGTAATTGTPVIQ